MVDTSTPRAYNSWWQARSDAWAQLEEASGQLAEAVLSGQPAGELIETTSGLLDALTPVEQYWAFPGPEAHRRIRDLFASASYGRFASLVSRVTRGLVTESYRAGIGWSLADDESETEEAGAGAPGHDRPARPYFEVLFVETLTSGEEQALREEARSWRRLGDDFAYELVVVASAEEAIIAA